MAKSRFLRRYARFTDQHGRKYGATVESETGHPCGVIDFEHRTPAGNLPPWRPSAEHLVFDTLEMGKVTIDYPKAIAQREALVADWERMARTLAIQMYGDKAGEAIEDPPVGLIGILGPRPMDAGLIEACQAGNKWALGFSDAMPEWATPYAVVTGVAQQKPRREFPDADEDTKQSRGARQRSAA